MGRISEAFSRAKGEGRSALVIYLCAGDPNLEATEEFIRAAARGGADVLEIGVPFSDPTADGPAIQRASERALKGGTTLPQVLDMVRRARTTVDVPILLFGYYNPILAYGEDKLVRDAQSAGVDGFLVVDLPIEESAPLRDPAVAAGMDFIPLLAPTSDGSRVELAARSATAFLYYVSMTGVTGAAATDLEGASVRAQQINDQTGVPVAVGFGVRTPDDARKAAATADGVVVGSAIVRVIESAESVAAAANGVEEAVRQLARAVDRSGT